MTQLQKPVRLLRDHQVTALTGIGRSARNRMIAAGKFPAGVKLSDARQGARVWSEADIAEWQAQLFSKTRSA